MPPSFCASAITCRATVVLPLDSGPKISTTLPRGKPPIPRAASKEMEPVEMNAIGTMASLAPSRMIEPRPNCFSIWDSARSMAFDLSTFSSVRAMFSPMRHVSRKANLSSLCSPARRNALTVDCHYTCAVEANKREILEQGRGPSSPALPLLLGDPFHVVDICAGLGHDMMQVIAHADKGKALLQEFTDPRRAEEKKPQDHVVLARMIHQLLRGRAQFRRGIHEREFILFKQAHRHAKVVLAQEEDIHARHGRDLRDVFDARGGFHLQGDNAVFIELAGI